MRVTALVHMYPPEHCAGAETHLHAMLSALARRGHKVDVVLSRQGGDPYTYQGVRVHPSQEDPKRVLGHIPTTDLLVTHLENTPRATFLGSFNAVPVVVVNHNTFDQSKEWLSHTSARVDLVVANSQWMRRDLVDYHRRAGLRLPAVTVVRPVAPAEFAADKPGDRVTLINLRRSAPGAGRDALTKGGELFRELAERMPRTRFLGVTGAYGEQQDMSGLANVDVIGHVPHHDMPAEVYGRTKILLVPSSYESWGRVGSEAMASGVPVIAHPTPGLVEQLGDAGTFVDRSDVDGWVNAIRRLGRSKEWAAASKKAKARHAELAVLGGADLDRWVTLAEQLGLASVVAA